MAAIVQVHERLRIQPLIVEQRPTVAPFRARRNRVRRVRTLAGGIDWRQRSSVILFSRSEEPGSAERADIPLRSTRGSILGILRCLVLLASHAHEEEDNASRN